MQKVEVAKVISGLIIIFLMIAFVSFWGWLTLKLFNNGLYGGALVVGLLTAIMAKLMLIDPFIDSINNKKNSLCTTTAYVDDDNGCGYDSSSSSSCD